MRLAQRPDNVQRGGGTVIVAALILLFASLVVCEIVVKRMEARGRKQRKELVLLTAARTRGDMGGGRIRR